MKDAYFLSNRTLTVVEVGTKKIQKHLNKRERKKACIMYSKIIYLDKGIVLYVHFIIIGLNASINILNLNFIKNSRIYMTKAKNRGKKLSMIIRNKNKMDQNLNE